MKVGLFFGSFNPIHTGHLIIAKYFADFTDLDQIWFVVSPQNPFKVRQDLLPGEQRLKLVNLAIADSPAFKSCDIELMLEKPSYTIHTLNALEGSHPNLSFVIIMGSDNLESLPLWKDYESIVTRFDIYVYPRPGFTEFQAMQLPGKRVSIIEAPLLEISSSFIRQMISGGKTPRYWLPERVLLEIMEAGYYS